MQSLSLSFAAATFLWLSNATGHAQTFVYDASLSGPNESPANASPGTGFAEVTINLTTNSLTVHVTFSGLTGTTTASHIHAPTPAPFTGTAGVATQTPSFSEIRGFLSPVPEPATISLIAMGGLACWVAVRKSRR